MDTFLQEPEKKKGINKVLLATIAVGTLLIATVIGLMLLNQSPKAVQDQALAGAFREGSPEFDTYTRRIIVQNDEDRTMQSPTALGTIVMSIGGKVRNMTGKTLTGLEMKVSVVDMLGKVVKDKTFTVIPDITNGISELETNQILPIQVSMEGFSKNDDRANIQWKVTAIKIK